MAHIIVYSSISKNETFIEILLKRTSVTSCDIKWHDF